jgi:hypothetical protein
MDGHLALNTPSIVSPEEWEDSPDGYPQSPPYEWWNWHDEYDNEPAADEEWLGRIAGSQGDAT